MKKKNGRNIYEMKRNGQKELDQFKETERVLSDEELEEEWQKEVSICDRSD